jgi:hypothetical protein
MSLTKEKIIKSGEELIPHDSHEKGVDPHWVNEARKMVDLAVAHLGKGSGVSIGELSAFFTNEPIEVLQTLKYVEGDKHDLSVLSIVRAFSIVTDCLEIDVLREMIGKKEKYFSDEMLKLGLTSKEALQLAIQASAGCKSCNETIDTIRSVYLLLTTGKRR